MTTNTSGAPPAPAVIVEPVTLRSWLTDHRDLLGASGTTGPADAHGRPPTALNDLLTILTHGFRTGWCTRPDIQRVAVLDAGTSRVVLVDLAGGQRLAGPDLDEDSLIRLDGHGLDATIDAAAHTLGVLAAQANSIVTAYDRAAVAGGQLTDRYVCIFGLTETQYRELETALGLHRYGLGRYKPWSAPNGVYLGNDLDLDAAIRYARRAGLAYRETREVHHDPRPRPSGPGAGGWPASTPGRPTPDVGNSHD